MHFRIVCVLHERQIADGHQCRFDLGGAHQVSMTISLALTETNEIQSMCMATGQWKKRAEKSEQAPSNTLVDQAYATLLDYVVRTVSALRWRRGQVLDHHSPIKSLSGFEWSPNGTDWNPRSLLREVRLTLSIVPSLAVSAAIKGEVECSVADGRTEPLGHQVYCEAWEQRRDNPRSALALGIAAAEIGFKQCVGSLVPEAKWLVDNLPTPPLVTMLTDYLPTLPAENRLNDQVLPPPPEVLEVVKKGVYMRNQILHGRPITLKHDTLIEILTVVRDVLYLLDYYAGAEWALACVRPQVLKALGAPS
jgi:hypothetical protein